MSYQNSSSNHQYSNTMSEENFNQIIDAILDGKYSWACVLILKAAGYNPLHYIPYRTYNRLIKMNCTSSQSSDQFPIQQKQQSNFKTGQTNQAKPKIRDLNYIKTNSHKQVKGGTSLVNTLQLQNISFLS
jgi:hypothetical protein